MLECSRCVQNFGKAFKIELPNSAGGIGLVQEFEKQIVDYVPIFLLWWYYSIEMREASEENTMKLCSSLLNRIIRPNLFARPKRGSAVRSASRQKIIISRARSLEPPGMNQIVLLQIDVVPHFSQSQVHNAETLCTNDGG